MIGREQLVPINASRRIYSFEALVSAMMGHLTCSCEYGHVELIQVVCACVDLGLEWVKFEGVNIGRFFLTWHWIELLLSACYSCFKVI